MENFYFLFITFFIRIYSKIKQNPIFLIEGNSPIVLSTVNDNNYYYVLTDIKSMQIEKESGKINEIKEGIHDLSNCIYVSDNEEKNIILTNDNICLCIKYSPFISFEDYDQTFSLDFNSNEVLKKIGGIWNQNNFVIYGFIEQNFFFISNSQISLLENIDSNCKLSCKFMDDEFYICARFNENNNNVDLICLKYHNDYPNSQFNSLSFYSKITLNKEGSSEIGLYDTPIGNIKLLCLQNTRTVKCRFYHILNFTKDGYIEYNLLGDEVINYLISNSFSEKDCDFSVFNSEFLFCCATIDCIFCHRIDNNNYNLIQQYKLYTSGKNSYLTIKNNNYFATLFYMNENEFRTNISMYYIYLPECNNKEYIMYYNINLKPEKYEIQLKELFKVQTNDYYFELLEPPDENGYFAINNTKIEEKQHILDNDYILEFFLTNMT